MAAIITYQLSPIEGLAKWGRPSMTEGASRILDSYKEIKLSEKTNNEMEADGVDVSGCAVATPNLVYVWTKTKAEFEAIALPEEIHEWRASDAVTQLRKDGKQWEQRVVTKSLDSGPVCVVFQWFEERHIQGNKE